VVSLVFFLATVLFFQTVTFSPIALASHNEDTNIPSWFKTNAKWWKEGKISDEDIINAIENLLKRGIIKLDSTKIKKGNRFCVVSLADYQLFLSFLWGLSDLSAFDKFNFSCELLPPFVTVTVTLACPSPPSV